MFLLLAEPCVIKVLRRRGGLYEIESPRIHKGEEYPYPERDGNIEASK